MSGRSGVRHSIRVNAIEQAQGRLPGGLYRRTVSPPIKDPVVAPLVGVAIVLSAAGVIGLRSNFPEFGPLWAFAAAGLGLAVTCAALYLHDRRHLRRGEPPHSSPRLGKAGDRREPQERLGTIALTAGLLSIVTAGIVTGPVAIYLGVRALRQQGREPVNRLAAIAGLVMGLVSTSALIVFALLIL